MNYKITNLTSKEITIGTIKIPASGIIATPSFRDVIIGRINNIPITRRVFETENLPPQSYGNFYIVDYSIAESLPMRNDLLVYNRNSLMTLSTNSLILS